MHLHVRAKLAFCAALGLAAAGLVPSPAAAAPPPNDDFANAETIPAYGTYSTDNTEATFESGEPVPSCAFTGTGPGPHSESSVWYSFLAPATEDVILHTRGSTATDTQLAVHTGDSLAALTEVACNDDIDAPSNLQSEVVLPAQAGAQYLVQVATWTDGDQSHHQGPIELSVTNEAPPPPERPENDDVEVASAIEPGTTVGSTVNATTQTFEAELAMMTGCDPQSTIWYAYFPGSSGMASLDLSHSNFNTTLVVYEVDETGTITNYWCDDDGGTGSTSFIEFPVVTGLGYYFQIGSAAGEQGDAALELFGPDGGGTGDGDVQVSGSAAKAAGAQIGFTVDVTSDGQAPDGKLTLDLPNGLKLTAVTSETLECDTGGPIVCIVPPMSGGDTHSVRITGTPMNEGPFTLDVAWQAGDSPLKRGSMTAFGRTSQREDDPDNNTARITASRSVVCDNKATAKANTAKGTSQGDILCGLGGADTLRGLDGNDLIFGGDGTDSLAGGGGRDRILGGAGNDGLVGGGGKDALDGGSGRDRCRESADTQTSCER